MNEIVNQFSLAGNKFMPEMHLKQPGFTYSACGPFAKNKERIQKFKETGDTNYIYKNGFDEACLQHDMANGYFKDLARITASDKILRDKAFNIGKIPKYDGYQRGLASILCYKCFDKKSAGSGVNMRANKSAFNNDKLTEELHKPIIKKSKKRAVYSRFKDNIWSADLADIQLISKFNKGFRFLLCVIAIFSKYAWVVPLKDNKGITITHFFQKILEESNGEPNNIWVDKGRELNKSSV